MEDPDSLESQKRIEQDMHPMQLALRNGQYTPGIVSWLVGMERMHSIDMIRKKSDDIEWQEAAIADLDQARGYEDNALSRLQDIGIQIPTDDPEYVVIVERQMSKTLEYL